MDTYTNWHTNLRTGQSCQMQVGEHIALVTLVESKNGSARLQIRSNRDVKLFHAGQIGEKEPTDAQ